jgi:hypothetical protein
MQFPISHSVNSHADVMVKPKKEQIGHQHAEHVPQQLLAILGEVEPQDATKAL